MSDSIYIHGTSATEQERLSLLNRLQNARCLAALALSPGERVVDFGSGLGQLTCDMARAVAPEGRAVGIEREEAQLARARANAAGVAGLELRRGEVTDPPLAPGEWGSFDVAHARFVLEHLRDPAGLVRVMLRAVRPGGRVVLTDDDHEGLRLWPECAEGQALWGAFYRSFERLGNDPLIGRKLATLLAGAGATGIRCRLIDYTRSRGDADFADAVRNVIEVVRGAREAVLDGAWSAARFDGALHAIARWAELPDATLWYAFSWAEGRRPA